MLIALAGSAFAPIVHMGTIEGVAGVAHFPLIHMAIVSMCYLVGTGFYVTHVPEKLWPGTFDLWVSGYSIPPWKRWYDETLG
jgi:adiponectin receptor